MLYGAICSGKSHQISHIDMLKCKGKAKSAYDYHARKQKSFYVQANLVEQKSNPQQIVVRDRLTHYIFDIFYDPQKNHVKVTAFY